MYFLVSVLFLKQMFLCVFKLFLCSQNPATLLLFTTNWFNLDRSQEQKSIIPTVFT